MPDPSLGGVTTSSDQPASSNPLSSTNHNAYIAGINKIIARELKRCTFNVEIEQLVSILGIQLPPVPDNSFSPLSPPQNHIQGQNSLVEFLNMRISLLNYPGIKFIDVGTRSMESDPHHSKDKPDIVALRNPSGQVTWADVAVSGEYKPQKSEGSAAEHQTHRYLRKILQAQPGIDVAMSFMVCSPIFHLYFANASAVLKVGPVDMTNDTRATFQCLGIICSFVTNYPFFPLIGRIKPDLNDPPTPYAFSQIESIDSIIGSCTFVFSAIESERRVICKSVWLPGFLVNHEFNIIKKLNRNGLTWGVPYILLSGVLDQTGPMSVTWAGSERLIRHRQVSIFAEDNYRTQPPHSIDNHRWTCILAGLADVTRTLFLSWKMAWIHHRDISVNNLIFPSRSSPALLWAYNSQIGQNIIDIPERKPLEILIDWGNSRQHHLPRGHPLAGQDRHGGVSGTLPFMSKKSKSIILKPQLTDGHI